MGDFPKPIKIKVFYDKELNKITGKDSEESIVSENLNFGNFLNFIFSSYPTIPRRFAPGVLGFLLNGREPKENEILRDGDKVEFLVFEIGKIRKTIELQIRKIINYYQIDTTFEEIEELIFNEEGRKDFSRLARLFESKINSDNLDEINEVLKFVNAAWNYFPHKSLKGLSPIERLKGRSSK